MTTASQAITDLLRLQAAYEKIMAGKARSSEFTDLADSIDWENQPPEFFTEVIGMAVTLEMPRFAYQLAKQGHELYPNDKLLRQAEYVLAPPRILETGRPPVPGLADSALWLEQHASEYRGQWVAVLSGELIGTAASRRELIEIINNYKDRPDLLVVKVL